MTTSPQNGEEKVVINPVEPGPVKRSGNVDFTGVPWKSVEWTGLCMLYLRACESRSADSILGDHLAANDVARIDYDFTRIHRVVRPAVNQFGIALRSAHFDAMINDFLDGHPNTVVLHLGCGLHSRALRLAIPEATQWIDIDLPQVIDLRRQLYSEAKNYRMLGASVTDAGWLDELPAGGPVMIVAEGLLMYLSPDQVSQLLHRLVDRFDTGELVADLLSTWAPRLSKILTSGIVKWGTRDGSELPSWEPRLRLLERRSVVTGFERIPVQPQRLLYRLQHAVSAARQYDQIFRYAF